MGRTRSNSKMEINKQVEVNVGMKEGEITRLILMDWGVEGEALPFEAELEPIAEGRCDTGLSRSRND